MRAPPPTVLMLAALALAACGDKDGDTANTDDTSDTAVEYEEGCIVVDGGRGYAHLDDAYTVASEGSVITLCDGTIEQTLVVDKSVTIVGPGMDQLIWNAPPNEVAIQVTGAANVEISGFTITSTRNGILVEDSSAVTLRELRFDAVANTGVKLIDSTDVTVDASEFLLPAYGGVEVDGGSATVSGSTFTNPTGFAVHAIGGGRAHVAGNAINGVIYTDDGTVDDGFALWATDNAVLTTDGNTLADNFVHVYTEDADLSMLGDVVTGGLYGVLAAVGEMSFEGVRIQDPYVVGLRVVTPDNISLTGVEVVGAPELVDPEEFDFDNFFGGGVTLATSQEIAIDGLLVEGYNNNGLMVLGFDNEFPQLAANDMTLTNNGRRALTMYSVDGVFTDVVVESTRLVIDPSEITGNYNSQSPGLTIGLWTSTLSWTGGGLSGSEDMGLINFQGAVQLDDFTLDGNANIGLWNYQGSLLATNTTFTNGSWSGSIVNRGGDLTVVGSTFSNNLEPYYAETVSENVVQATEYNNASQDVVCYEASTCTLQGNTFVDGSRGVQIALTTAADLTGNTFTNYHSYVIYAYSNEGGEITVTDNVMSEIGAYPLRCSSSTMTVDGLEINGVHGAQVTYTYYTDGVETGGFSYSSTSAAVYGTSCTLSLSDLSIIDADHHALYAYDTALELEDVEVSGGGGFGSQEYGSIRTYFSSVTPYLVASNVSIADAAPGHGFQIGAVTSLSQGTVLLDTIEVSDASRNGLQIDGVKGGTFTGLTATSSGNHGAELTNTDGTLSSSTFESNGGYGVRVNGSSTGMTINTTSASANGAGGLFLGNATASVQSNTFTSNATYGMVCDTGVVLSACSSNTLTSNASGEHQGCDDACGQP